MSLRGSNLQPHVDVLSAAKGLLETIQEKYVSAWPFRHIRIYFVRYGIAMQNELYNQWGQRGIVR